MYKVILLFYILRHFLELSFQFKEPFKCLAASTFAVEINRVMGKPSGVSQSGKQQLGPCVMFPYTLCGI